MRNPLCTLTILTVLAAPLGAEAGWPVTLDPGALRCQVVTLRLGGRLADCVTDCWARGAVEAARGRAYDVDQCTTRCEDRFHSLADKLVGCPPCTAAGARAALARLATASAEQSAAIGYCMRSEETDPNLAK